MLFGEFLYIKAREIEMLLFLSLKKTLSDNNLSERALKIGKKTRGFFKGAHPTDTEPSLLVSSRFTQPQALLVSFTYPVP
jgi:hypothetical protein